ncbi:hypothetical protein [Nocardioides limicola]|uniref:hypothetical protein n=1 Tax=Nocardioides limicola TaxID=2803368 RepID=UPI00193C2C43|nr:hypothetical protein [Nocardioides sp. DJM-14]
MTTGQTGKRAARHAAPAATSSRIAVLGYAAAVTGTLVAWGYLVLAAIDFGTAARDGRTAAWLFLAVAGFGAIACLFAALMLLTRVLRHLGIARPPRDPAAPRPSGGKRAAR